MRLKVVRAARLSDALAELRGTLGEDAVILSTRRVAGGVEVTAGEAPEDEPLVIPPDAAPRARALPPGLARHNVPAALAERLVQGPLPAALAAALAFAPLPDGPLMLAGPPGAGKTLTTAKLAARAVLAGRRPLLVTADGRRAGAAEQLAAFARVLGLAKAVRRAEPAQPVLVDLPGIDPFNAQDATMLAGLMQAAGGTALLVQPAGLDPDEAAETARAFALLGCRHLLPTRLDAARRLGGVLSAAAAGLSLTEAGTGQDPAGDLVPITPDWLAARLQRGVAA
jgi:flagellar biosynthesis protein FlhF